MSLNSALAMNHSKSPFLIEKRIKLLSEVEKTGSISKAAKAVPLSYKAAWDAIQTMNNLSEHPLVECSTGGKGGGGAKITAYGKKVVKLFTDLEKSQAQLLEQFDSSDGEIKTIHRMGLQLSARNQLHGRVKEINTNDVLAHIQIVLNNQESLTSSITKEASESLGLCNMSEVIAIFKASAVKLMLSGEDYASSEQNSFEATICSIYRCDANAEVTVTLSEGEKITASIPSEQCNKLGLKRDERVNVIINPCDIMVGV